MKSCAALCPNAREGYKTLCSAVRLGALVCKCCAVHCDSAQRAALSWATLCSEAQGLQNTVSKRRRGCVMDCAHILFRSIYFTQFFLAWVMSHELQ